MKKTYINPTLEVVKINTGAQLLAGSTIPTGTTPTNPSGSDARWFDDDDSFFDE